MPGATDLLSVIQTQTCLIGLHLAIGGSFDAASAAGMPAPP
jgi:hypothetical protein